MNKCIVHKGVNIPNIKYEHFMKCAQFLSKFNKKIYYIPLGTELIISGETEDDIDNYITVLKQLVNYNDKLIVTVTTNNNSFSFEHYLDDKLHIILNSINRNKNNEITNNYKIKNYERYIIIHQINYGYYFYDYYKNQYDTFYDIKNEYIKALNYYHYILPKWLYMYKLKFIYNGWDDIFKHYLFSYYIKFIN